MWKFKTDRMGNIATAVERRVALFDADKLLQFVDLNSHKSRAMFGYNYLEWKYEDEE